MIYVAIGASFAAAVGGYLLHKTFFSKNCTQPETSKEEEFDAIQTSSQSVLATGSAMPQGQGEVECFGSQSSGNDSCVTSCHEQTIKIEENSDQVVANHLQDQLQTLKEKVDPTMMDVTNKSNNSTSSAVQHDSNQTIPEINVTFKHEEILVEVSGSTEKNPVEIIHAENPELIQREKAKLNRQETLYDSANVITFVSRMNICCGIFKNPSDHMTHYYRKRLTGEPIAPSELRNIAASVRIWEKYWDRINSINICQKSCDCLEEPSEWIARLDDLRESVEDKIGCRISLKDFDSLATTDKRVLGDLLNKVHNNCISEDDLTYFNLKNDSDYLEKEFFAL